MKLTQKELADLYAGLREEKVISQSKLAKELSVDYRTISQYENGERPLSIKTLEKYADYFGVSTDYLLGRIEVRLPNPDMQSLHLVTGLTDNALHNLNLLLKAGQSDIASMIISNPRFLYAISSMELTLNNTASITDMHVFIKESEIQSYCNGERVNLGVIDGLSARRLLISKVKELMSKVIDEAFNQLLKEAANNGDSQNPDA